MRAKRQFAQTAATRLPAGDPFETKDLIVRTEHGRSPSSTSEPRGKRRRERFEGISRSELKRAFPSLEPCSSRRGSLRPSKSLELELASGQKCVRYQLWAFRSEAGSDWTRLEERSLGIGEIHRYVTNCRDASSLSLLQSDREHLFWYAGLHDSFFDSRQVRRYFLRPRLALAFSRPTRCDTLQLLNGRS